MELQFYSVEDASFLTCFHFEYLFKCHLNILAVFIMIFLKHHSITACECHFAVGCRLCCAFMVVDVGLCIVVRSWSCMVLRLRSCIASAIAHCFAIAVLHFCCCSARFAVAVRRFCVLPVLPWVPRG